MRLKRRFHNLKIRIGKRGNHVFADLILIGIVVASIYVSIVALGINIPVINPSPAQTVIPITAGWWFTENNSVVDATSTPDAVFAIFLRCDGILTANKKVTISGVGYLTEPTKYDLLTVGVKFPFTYKYPAQNDSKNIPIDWLLELHRDSDGSFSGSSIDFYFTGSGDYTIKFAMQSSTMQAEVPQSSTISPLVHVEPESQLVVEKVNQVTFGITIALFYFGFIEIIKTWLEIRSKK